MTAAALGTTVPITTFDGDRDVDVRPGTQPGDVLTLKDLGVTALRSERRGDIRVAVDVVVPKNLSSEQREILEGFAAARGEEAPRHAGPPSERGGFFSGLRDRLRDL